MSQAAYAGLREELRCVRVETGGQHQKYDPGKL